MLRSLDSRQQNGCCLAVADLARHGLRRPRWRDAVRREVDLAVAHVFVNPGQTLLDGRIQMKRIELCTQCAANRTVEPAQGFYERIK